MSEILQDSNLYNNKLLGWQTSKLNNVPPLDIQQDLLTTPNQSQSKDESTFNELLKQFNIEPSTKPPAEKVGFFEGVAQGITTTIDPTGVLGMRSSIDRLRTQRTTLGSLGYIGAAILADIGVGTAITMTTGANPYVAIPAMIAYGMYSGFGAAKLDADIQNKDYSVADGTLLSVASINPFLRVGTKATRVATQLGVLGTYAARQDMGLLESTLTVGLGGLAPALTKQDQLLSIGELFTRPSSMNKEGTQPIGAIKTLAESIETPSTKQMIELQSHIDNLTPLPQVYIDNWKKKQAVPLVDTKKTYTIPEFETLTKQYGFEPINTDKKINYTKARVSLNEFPISTSQIKSNTVSNEMVNHLNKSIIRKERETLRMFGRSFGTKINQSYRNRMGDWLHTRPDQDIQVAYKNAHSAQILVKYLAQANTPMSQKTKDPIGFVTKWLKDPSELFIQTDHWLDGYSNMSGVQSNILQGVDKANIDIHAWRKEITKPFYKAYKEKISPHDIHKYLESPQLLDKLSDSDPTKEVVKEFQTILRNFAEYINHNGGKIELKKNYVHHTTKSLSEQRKYFSDTYSTLKTKYGDPTTWKIKKVSSEVDGKISKSYKFVNPEINKFIEELSFHKGKTNFINPKTLKSSSKQKGKEIIYTSPVNDIIYNRLITSLTDVAAVKKQQASQRTVTAGLKREGAIPQALLETDIFKSTLSYMEQNIRSIHMKDALDQLHREQVVLAGLAKLPKYKGVIEGLNTYLNKYAKSILGQSSETKLWIETVQQQMRYSALKLYDQVNKLPTMTLDNIKHSPKTMFHKALLKVGADMQYTFTDFLGWASSQYYPSLLGFSVSKTIRGALQSYTTTAPEISSVARSHEGYTLVSKGYAKFALKLADKTFNLSEELKRLGLHPGDTVTQFTDELNLELSRIGVSKFGRAVDTFNQWGTYLYSNADMMNRYMSYQLGHDIVKKAPTSKGLTKYLESLPPGIRNEIIMNPDKAGDIVGRWLVKKTQFHYTKPALNQFARTFGRAASAFTRWPVALASDIHTLTVTGRKDTAMIKYLTPFVVLSAIHQGLEYADSYKNPTVKLLLGSQVTGLSALPSAISISLPPLITMPNETLKAFSQLFSDPPRNRKEIDFRFKTFEKSALPFVPLSGIYYGYKGNIQEYIEDEPSSGFFSADYGKKTKRGRKSFFEEEYKQK